MVLSWPGRVGCSLNSSSPVSYTHLDVYKRQQIRCALDPDEPRLLDQYLGEARYLAGWEGVAAWPLFEKAYNLLLDTGRDPILPWHWRSLCLDYAYRPLCELQRLTTNGSQRRRLRQLSVRMARQDLAPSMSFDHPQQGNQDD